MSTGATEHPAASASKQSARVLGLFDSTCIVIGAIIGVGIFTSPYRVAGLTGTSELALLAWTIAGGIALCGALAFAELGGMYNRSGAQYEIIRDAFGPLPGFLFVFCNATAVQAGAIGIIALVCASNIGVAISDGALTGLTQLLAAVLLILGLSFANGIGVRFGSGIQNITVAAKLLTLLAVAILAVFFAPSHSPTMAATTNTTSPVALGGVSGVMAALVPAMFAYGGWQQALWIAGEVRQPQRNLPRAIVGGVIIVIAAYLLVNWSYLQLLGIDGVIASRAVAADAVASVMPNIGRRLIAGAVAISAFGVLNAQLLAGPHLIYGMARDGRFFAAFGRMSRRFATPVAAIALLTIVALVPLLLLREIDRIDQLLTWAVLIDSIFFGLTAIALIVLRRTRPNALRPVRVPGYPVTPLLFAMGVAGTVVGSFLDPNVRGAAMIGAAWIAGAALVYAIWFRGGPISERS